MKTILIATAAAGLLISSQAFAGGDVAEGKAKSATCAGCHGADGTSPTPMYPHLGGQYESYLLQALKEYKSGARNNAIMAGMVASLNEEDLENLAAFYASQDGPLSDGTVKP